MVFGKSWCYFFFSPPFLAAFFASASSMGAGATKGISSLYFSGMYILREKMWIVDKYHGTRIILESIGNSNASLGLVHLQEDADDPGDRAQGGVEHVAVLGGGVHLLGLPVAHPQPPRLVVKAVAAADKLPESSPSREPRLKVELFGSRIIQST